MQVVLFPHQLRPDIGKKPVQVAQRPDLPQRARLCPVLEAGSALGFLVYAPLRHDEAYQVSCEDMQHYQLSYYRDLGGGDWQSCFKITYVTAVSGNGTIVRREIAQSGDAPALSDAQVAELEDALIVPSHFGVPAGAVGLRGAHDFRTPPGWDTVYGAVLNHVSPPVVPALTVRVETDWYAHDTEFRYVLQPGDVIQVTAEGPIGQVFFVPREAHVLRAASNEEFSAFRDQLVAFKRLKRDTTQATAFGPSFSPLYSREQQAKKASSSKP
jgi:hypothetical protein